MKTVIIIPARYASRRYPGKPLVGLRGADGVSKPLIERSWEAAMAVPGIAEVFVATDDDRIREVATGFGAKVVMTSQTCENGTMRCAEALEHERIDADLIVNLQGDSPLTPRWFVAELIDAMATGQDIAVATPVIRCDEHSYRNLRTDRAEGRVGGTTAVFDRQMRALYFSKEVIPFTDGTELTPPPVFQHVGVYAYRRDALNAYRGWPRGPLEANEGLEQLRFLENATPILCVEVDGRGQMVHELNNPVDVERIEAALGAQP